MSSVDDIKKDMLEDEEDNNETYLDRLREVSGTGLVNTRIADRESEVTNLTLYECLKQYESEFNVFMSFVLVSVSTIATHFVTEQRRCI